jgi:hypothetical protein
MIVPANLLQQGGSGPLGATNDNPAPPSQANLLMAAAAMHKMGRLKGASKSAPKPKATDEDSA